MDLFKKKLEKLRLDADASTTRAEKAEVELKEARDHVSKRDTEILNLTNKVTLLTEDLQRQEKRVEEAPLHSFDLTRGQVEAFRGRKGHGRDGIPQQASQSPRKTSRRQGK